MSLQEYRLSSYFKTEKHKDIFIYLVLNNIPTSTALFFISALDVLEEEGDMSATAMGRLSRMTTGAALYHNNILANLGILERTGYRKWSTTDKYFEIVKPYKDAEKAKLNEAKRNPAKYM